MSTTQAKIAAKKLTEKAGIPDDLADHMFHSQEAHWVAIIDLAHLDRTEGRGEKHVVRLEIDQLEVVTGDMAEHARELMAAAYRERTGPGQLALDGDDESADEIIRRGRNILLLCDTCLHKAADDRISHTATPEADGAECTWKDSGLAVRIDEDTEADLVDEAEAALDDDVVEAEAEIVGDEEDGEIPGDDGPWPGDADYTAPTGTTPDLTPTLGSPFATSGADT